MLDQSEIEQWRLERLYDIDKHWIESTKASMQNCATFGALLPAGLPYVAAKAPTVLGWPSYYFPLVLWSVGMLAAVIGFLSANRLLLMASMSHAKLVMAKLQRLVDPSTIASIGYQPIGFSTAGNRLNYLLAVSSTNFVGAVVGAVVLLVYGL